MAVAAQTVRLRVFLAALLFTTAALALVKRTDRVTLLLDRDTPCTTIEGIARQQDCVAECPSEEPRSAYIVQCFSARPLAETIERLGRAPGVRRAVRVFQAVNQ